MSTLITSGCSYTEYNFPCWNMWLGQHYERHLPLGKAGTGPKYSYIRIRDYFKYEKNINPKDHHVIVQWSSLLRHDYRINYHRWSGGGLITNNSLFSDDYVDNYFNIIDSTCDLLYYIESLISLSKELGFKLHMLYMFEPWADRFFGEPTSIETDKVAKEYDEWQSSEYLESLKEHYESDYFIPCSIESFCLDNPKKNNVQAISRESTIHSAETLIIDKHPSPLQHFKYFKFLSTQLNLHKPPPEWAVLANQLEDIMCNSKSHTIFIDIFYLLVTKKSSLWYWKGENHYKGQNENHNIDLIKKCLVEYNKEVNVT